jgi:hypothetical protein
MARARRQGNEREGELGDALAQAARGEGDHLAVIEGQGRHRRALVLEAIRAVAVEEQAQPRGVGGVVGSHRLAGARGRQEAEVRDGDDPPARIAPGRGEAPQLFEADVAHAGLLGELARGGLRHRLLGHDGGRTRSVLKPIEIEETSGAWAPGALDQSV